MAGDPKRRGTQTPDSVRRNPAIHRDRQRPRGIHPPWPCPWMGGGTDPGNPRRWDRRTPLRDVPADRTRVLSIGPLSPVEDPSACGWHLRVALYPSGTRYGDQDRKSLV